MAFLAVITGPPGAGKSTVAGLLADEFEKSVLVEGDAFFAFLARGAIEPWLPAAHRQNEVVIRAAAAAAGGYVAGGYSTVYDGVLGPWFLADFAAATAPGYLHYAVLLPSVERCVAQVSGRTGHEFTDEAATRHMHQDFAGAGIDQRHVLADSSGPADPGPRHHPATYALRACSRVLLAGPAGARDRARTQTQDKTPNMRKLIQQDRGGSRWHGGRSLP